MEQITVESSIGERLSKSAGQVVVCDVEGRVIGFFSPLKGHPRIDDLQLEPPLSISETEELRKKIALASHWKKFSDGWAIDALPRLLDP